MFAMALILMNRNPSLSADNTWTETYWPLHTPMKREVKIHQHRSFENYQYHHYNIRQLSVQTKESMTLLQYAVCSIQHTLWSYDWYDGVDNFQKNDVIYWHAICWHHYHHRRWIYICLGDAPERPQLWCAGGVEGEKMCLLEEVPSSIR